MVCCGVPCWRSAEGLSRGLSVALSAFGCHVCVNRHMWLEIRPGGVFALVLVCGLMWPSACKMGSNKRSVSAAVIIFGL